MKKNGFTLVEILAVIVILGIIITMAVPGVTKIAQKVETSMYCTKVENIEKTAQLWGNDYYDLVNGSKDKSMTEPNKYVTISELVKKGYQKKDDKNPSTPGVYVVDPRDDSSMMDKRILVFIKNGRVYAEFEFGDEDAETCK